MTRVLVIDDSALVRRVLSDELSGYPDIEVVGAAADPYMARDQIVALKPDVLTLDIEMPRMNGLAFLAKLMRFHPLPVIVVSSLATENSEMALEALRLGAVDVVSKPGSQLSTPDVSRKLVRAIRAAATARPNAVRGGDASARPVELVEADSSRLIVVGASTGGPQALEILLRRMPATSPGIVIVQHMPAQFTTRFAESLNAYTELTVREAADGEPVRPGEALVAPGDYHLLVQGYVDGFVVRLKRGPQVHFQRPAVDVCFQSAAFAAGAKAIGVLLTGMGADGARGLLAMREAGASTIAQNEATSVVYGMPREAAALGAAESILPLTEIPAAIASILSGERAPTS